MKYLINKDVIRIKSARYGTVVALTMALAACGGGGGGSVVGSSTSTPSAATYSTLVTTSGSTSLAPVSNAKDRQNLSSYGNVRSYAFADFNGDGCADMGVAPTYVDHAPHLPLEIWAGDCKGGFAKDTSILTSAVTTGSVNNLFVRDFNGDGRPDILIIDQGLEDKDAASPGFDGAPNQLLLSDNAGHLVAQPSTFMDNNGNQFNHLSAVGDLNGDGNLDLVLVRLGGPNFGTNAGAVVYYGDGHGHFTSDTSKLPAEVSPPTNTFQVGGAAIADLDGDGVPEIVLVSYTNTTQEVIVLKLNSTSYTVAKRYAITASLANIGYDADTKASATSNRGLGGSSIAVADFDGDGNKDIAVLWEGISKSYLQVLKGGSGLNFTDVTDTWMNGLTLDHSINGGTIPVSRLSIADVNGDGVSDLVAESFSYSLNDLQTRSPFLVYSAGKFQFKNVLGTYSANTAATYLGVTADAQMGFKSVDFNNDGKFDLMAVYWNLGSPTAVNNSLSYYTGTNFFGAVAN